MGCTMRGSSPLPNRVGWVHSTSFPQKVFSDRLPTIAGPALPQRYASGWLDGRKGPGGAEKARLQKRKALGEDAAKCAKLTDSFSRGQTQVATGKERHRHNDRS